LQYECSNLFVEIEALEGCHDQENYLNFQAKHNRSWKNETHNGIDLVACIRGAFSKKVYVQSSDLIHVGIEL